MSIMKLRIILRWTHLVLGVVIAFYIYSPFHENDYFGMFVRWGVVPSVILSGLWIWKFAAINKFLNIETR